MSLQRQLFISTAIQCGLTLLGIFTLGFNRAEIAILSGTLASMTWIMTYYYVQVRASRRRRARPVVADTPFPPDFDQWTLDRRRVWARRHHRPCFCWKCEEKLRCYVIPHVDFPEVKT